MSKTRAQMIARASHENLCFVFETPKSAGMDYAITVALILSSPFGRWFGIFSPATVTAELRVRRKKAVLARFKLFAGTGHLNCGLKPRIRPQLRSHQGEEAR